MLSVFRNAWGALQQPVQLRKINREFVRLGLTDAVVAARAQELDAADRARVRKGDTSYGAIARDNEIFLAALRAMPDNAGPDAVIAQIRALATGR